MSKRARLRKAKKLAYRDELKEVFREQNKIRQAKLKKIMRKVGVILGILIVAAGVVLGGIWVGNTYFGSVTGPFGKIKKSELAQSKYAIISTTKGNLRVELDVNNTPKTAANFVLLAKSNFYDGIKFHRIIKDFMVQTGDPLSKDSNPDNDGQGGPGYKFDDEKFTGEYTRGTVAMANSGANTNGSQFFIVDKDTNLPKNYVIFGHLVGGWETLDAIANTPVEDNGQGEVSRPTEEVSIVRITLADKP